MKVWFGRSLLLPVAAAIATVASAAPGPGNAVLVSVGLSGAAGDSDSYEGTISDNGRYLAWHTSATNLGIPDTNNTWDIVLADRRKGRLRIVSLDDDGGQASGGGGAVYPMMSANGRWIVYQTDSPNIASGAAAGIQVILVDAKRGTSREISVGPIGEPGDGASALYSARPISANGRWIVFSSASSNLVGGADGPNSDVFLADAKTGEITLVSQGLGGLSNGASVFPSISPNGRWIVFNSIAGNLTEDDGDGVEDVFLHDVKQGTTRRVSRPAAGGTANNHSGVGYASAVSNSGRLVAFSSLAGNLDPDFPDNNPDADLFLADLGAGTVRLISRATDGGAANGPSGNAVIDAAGRVVTYRTEADNLNAPATAASIEQIAYEVTAGTTTRALHAFEGGPVDGLTFGLANGLSHNGRWFVLNSNGSNLVESGTNGAVNVFLVDLKPMKR